MPERGRTRLNDVLLHRVALASWVTVGAAITWPVPFLGVVVGAWAVVADIRLLLAPELQERQRLVRRLQVALTVAGLGFFLALGVTVAFLVR